jgi:hypothetical protein
MFVSRLQVLFIRIHNFGRFYKRFVSTLCYKFGFYIIVGDIWYFITLVSNMDEGVWNPSHHLLKELESKAT